MSHDAKHEELVIQDADDEEDEGVFTFPKLERRLSTLMRENIRRSRMADYDRTPSPIEVSARGSLHRRSVVRARPPSAPTDTEIEVVDVDFECSPPISPLGSGDEKAVSPERDVR